MNLVYGYINIGLSLIYILLTDGALFQMCFLIRYYLEQIIIFLCAFLIVIIHRTHTVTLFMIRHLSEPQKTFPVVAHVRSQ